MRYPLTSTFPTEARAFAFTAEAEPEAFASIAGAEQAWYTVITAGSRRTSDSFQSTHCLLVRCSCGTSLCVPQS